MAATKVAVVTGSNKGIGFAIVRGLCKQFEGNVYLTSRDESLGKAAVAKLEEEGLKPRFHQLDIDNPQSTENLKQFLLENYGGLDLLVNNAGVLHKQDTQIPFSQVAEDTLRTNYWSTLHVSEVLFPILRPHARVVHVSSTMSLMTLEKCSPELQKRLKSVSNFEELNALMNEFQAGAKAGNPDSYGWPKSLFSLSATAYGVSKIGVTLMARIHQEQFDEDGTRDDVIVNACCPGYVKTDMTDFKGFKTVEEGADTPLFVALLPPGATSPKGKFISEREVKEF